MKPKILYRFERKNGGITHSLNKPEGVECTELCRLIAGEGKMLTKDGVSFHSVVDTDTPGEWREVDAPPEVEEGGEGVVV